MEDKVNEATNPNPPMDVLSSAFKLDITRKDIRTLVGLEVIPDEIFETVRCALSCTVSQTISCNFIWTYLVLFWQWLNDEIINFYMNMLVDRSEKSEGALPKVCVDHYLWLFVRSVCEHRWFMVELGKLLSVCLTFQYYLMSRRHTRSIRSSTQRW